MPQDDDYEKEIERVQRPTQEAGDKGIALIARQRGLLQPYVPVGAGLATGVACSSGISPGTPGTPGAPESALAAALGATLGVADGTAIASPYSTSAYVEPFGIVILGGANTKVNVRSLSADLLNVHRGL